VLLSVVLVLLAGCGASTTSLAAPVVAVRVAIAPLASTLPVHFADAHGIFARHGLRIERTEGQDLSAFAAGLAQGRYDLAVSVPTIVLVGAARGLDVQVVSRLQESSAARPGTVWITKDPTITSIGQLRNRTVAVPALSGQITDSLRYLLQRSGIDGREVTFVQLPFAAMADQLAAGRIDVAVAGPPFSTAMAARGSQIHEDVVVEAVRQASDDTVDNGMTALLASSSAFTNAHPEVIRAFRASLTEAISYLQSHDAEARELLQTWLRMPPEVARTTSLPTWSVEIAPRDLQPYATISKAVGTIDRELDVGLLVWEDAP
jgi:ABC-type nitrate/sulfonate/bicarbonate transport system substrate-binding protein